MTLNEGGRTNPERWNAPYTILQNGLAYRIVHESGEDVIFGSKGLNNSVLITTNVVKYIPLNNSIVESENKPDENGSFTDYQLLKISAALSKGDASFLKRQQQYEQQYEMSMLLQTPSMPTPTASLREYDIQEATRKVTWNKA